MEFNAENYLSRKLSHTVNPRKSKLETGKAAETKPLPNSGRISPEKQRLPVSTKLAFCLGHSVSRLRSSAPPFPIQISARPHFPSIRGLLLGSDLLLPGLRTRAQRPRPSPPGSAIRVQPPASCPPGLALQPGLHFSAATSPAQSPASRLPPRRSRLGLSVLDPPPVLRAPQLQPGLRALAGRCRASTAPARPPTAPDRVSSSTASVLALAPVVVAEQRILRPDRAHLLRHPRAAAGPDRSLGRVLGLEGWRELAQG